MEITGLRSFAAYPHLQIQWVYIAWFCLYVTLTTLMGIRTVKYEPTSVGFDVISATAFGRANANRNTVF